MPTVNPGRLKELRERRVLTQSELAEKAGVRSATVTDIETGKHRPRPSTIRKLAKALSVGPEELF